LTFQLQYANISLDLDGGGRLVARGWFGLRARCDDDRDERIENARKFAPNLSKSAQNLRQTCQNLRAGRHFSGFSGLKSASLIDIVF